MHCKRDSTEIRTQIEVYFSSTCEKIYDSLKKLTVVY